MKRLLIILAGIVSAVTLQAQTTELGMTYEELYIKMKGDSVLQTIYFQTTSDISKAISLDWKVQEASAAVNNEWNLKVQQLGDSLGVNPKDGAGTKEHHKFYNPNVDTVTFIKFLELREPIDQKYSPLSSAASESIRTQYHEMVKNAFADAAVRYYQNLRRAKNQ